MSRFLKVGVVILLVVSVLFLGTSCDGFSGAEDGVDGAKGDTGNGIESAVNNGDGTFTLNFTDGTSFTTPDLTGPAGPQGIQGEPGTAGTSGGGIDSITDNEDGTFTFNFDDGSSFTTPDLTGPQGETGLQGEPGEQGEQGEVGDTGPKGDKGDTGDSFIIGLGCVIGNSMYLGEYEDPAFATEYGATSVIWYESLGYFRISIQGSVDLEPGQFLVSQVTSLEGLSSPEAVVYSSQAWVAGPGGDVALVVKIRNQLGEKIRDSFQFTVYSCEL